MNKILLIVDDEKAVLNSLKRLFRKSSFKVLTSTTASDALDIIRNEPIAVLLSDFSMPEMTGATLLSKAKEIRPNMARIILSGQDDQTAVIRSLNEGSAHRFLTKPWDNSLLVREVEDAFLQYRATQHLGDGSEILTHTALTEWLEHALSDPTIQVTVLTFCVDQNSFHSGSNELSILHNTIASRISAMTCMANTSYALGCVSDSQYCLCFCKKSDLKTYLDEINSGLPEIVHMGGTDYPLHFYLGFTQSQKRQAPADLFLESSIALNEAKASKCKTPVPYKKHQLEKYRRSSSLELQLLSAIEKEEIHLNYQPKISASDHSLCGAEALIRWNNPELGFVSPIEFIPVAETNELIHPIGLWVLERSIEDWLSWFGPQQIKTRISVNVSTVQLRNQNFHREVEMIINRFKIDPACIELELTESSLIEDTIGTRDILNELKKLGLHLSIDDFGTGYSSLSYLCQFPIDTIKIDRSFVQPLLYKKSNEDLVKNIIALAKDLDKETVAEGVETEEQMLKLTALGCDVIQGYFFSKPLSSSDFISTYCASRESNEFLKFDHSLVNRKLS